MMNLLPLMLERVGILLIVAFLLSRLKSFRHIIHRQHVLTDKIKLIFIFGTFAMISNYTGVEIQGTGQTGTQAWQTWISSDSAIANTRIMGVVVGGLLGGPLVGTGVGIIAGLHRFTLGGFTAFACGMSSILAGIVTGFIGKRLRIMDKSALWKTVIIGILMECIQMGIILATAPPFAAALSLVNIITVPMVVINGFGMLLFMLVIQAVLQEESRTRALQTHQVFEIADQTLPYFRQGLNPHSCREAAAVILSRTNADAISITDSQQVLAHVGEGSDHHVPLERLSTRLTRKVLSTGTVMKAVSRDEIQCRQPDCCLEAAIVLPLKVHEKTVGTLKLYFKNPGRLDQVEQEVAEGLGRLFSTQLELAEAEQQRKRLKDAEIKALQAQIHPHFLFNAFNTVSALCRTDPEKARMLLLQMSSFFRSNLQGARQPLIPLYKELENVNAYLAIEQARFPGKFTLETKIDPSLKTVGVPPFLLQPLVENALRYAFPSQVEDEKGKVTLSVYRDGEYIMLKAEDNGQGIEPYLLQQLGKREIQSARGTGTALYNISKRIEEMFGAEADFRIRSKPGSGTAITIRLPIQHSLWRDLYA
ncbi:LytS/YhcK type 5TM receptor domain-containing protein [Paenibacillus terreus]|uniref:histidine kinase n=1 Tax=Paenibacillus terreus TaxID=1387834 RepID=A0ABV5BAN5_9BACL